MAERSDATCIKTSTRLSAIAQLLDKLAGWFNKLKELRIYFPKDIEFLILNAIIK
jgi:hypothetical protein